MSANSIDSSIGSLTFNNSSDKTRLDLWRCNKDGLYLINVNLINTVDTDISWSRFAVCKSNSGGILGVLSGYGGCSVTEYIPSGTSIFVSALDTTTIKANGASISFTRLG